MSEYMVFALAFAASAASPGPEIAGLLSRALSGGVFASFSLALGIILGKLLMLTAAVLGLTALVEVIGPMFIVLKFCGAVYLVWLGIKKWKNAGRMLAVNEKPKPVNAIVDIGLGLTMTLSNPIAILFYIALLPGVINISGLTLNSYALLCTIIICVMTCIVVGYGIMAEVVRKRFSSANSKALMDRFAGAMMIGAGILIAIR
ncbi:LysE family translocator [Brevibacillus choshinensis]|uniref:LysE family translocator n=1 Tax=Brevibacillus choshinensis TaxID=54911 RepID=UPI002E2334F3|nr:LysE family translocator [Brevibacillus choshinensis]